MGAVGESLFKVHTCLILKHTWNLFLMGPAKTAMEEYMYLRLVSLAIMQDFIELLLEF